MKGLMYRTLWSVLVLDVPDPPGSSVNLAHLSPIHIISYSILDHFYIILWHAAGQPSSRKSWDRD